MKSELEKKTISNDLAYFQVCKQWYDILHGDPTLPLSKSIIILDYNSINDPEKVDAFFQNFSQTILDGGGHLEVERLTLIGWSVGEIKCQIHQTVLIMLKQDFKPVL